MNRISFVKLRKDLRDLHILVKHSHFVSESESIDSVVDKIVMGWGMTFNL
jgi:hypothetical protein